ncbi:LysR family transcriptional regulator [Pseudomonas sp. SDO528_S397]
MLDDLAIFVQIVRSGSFSLASKKLDMPANTLSRRLASLEQLMGTPLLLRSTRALRCTAAGELLYQHSCASIDALHATVASIQQLDGEPRGKARVHVSTSFFEYSDTHFLQVFLDKYPALELELIVSDIEPNLTEQGIDLSLRVGQPKKSSAVVHKLRDVTLGLYASTQYLEKHGTPLTLADLTTHEHLQYLGKTHENRLTLQRQGQTYNVPVRGRFSSDSMLGLINAAHQGLGIALLNNVMTRFEQKDLVRVLPEYYLPTDGFYAVYPNQKSLSTAARAVLNHMIDKADICRLR